MKDSPREQTLKKVALAISKITLPHTVRVGIDGMSASGKTFLADELANILREEGKRVIRVGLDGFHNHPKPGMQKGTCRSWDTSKIPLISRQLRKRC